MRYQNLSKEVLDDIVSKFVEKKDKEIHMLSTDKDKKPIDRKTKK